MILFPFIFGFPILPIQVSMAKERKRLINEDLVQEVGPGAGQPGRDNPGQDRDQRTNTSAGGGGQLRGNQIVVDSSRPDLLN